MEGVFGCYSQRKVKNSESKSQLWCVEYDFHIVVIHSVKLKILKANHNKNMVTQIESVSCYSQRKVKNSESKSQQFWCLTLMFN